MFRKKLGTFIAILMVCALCMPTGYAGAAERTDFRAAGRAGNLQSAQTAKAKLSATKATVVIGSTLTLTVKNLDDSKVSAIKWKSNRTSIAKVNQKGVVTPVKAGTTTIKCTITYKDKTKQTLSCTVTVKKRVKATAIVINNTEKAASLKVGKRVTLKASLSPANTTDQVYWFSSNKAVATVGLTNGKVTAKKEGTVVITAKVGLDKKGATAKTNKVVTEIKIEVKSEDEPLKDTDDLGIRDGINKSEIEDYIALAEAFEAEGMHERAVELLQRVYGETGDEILGRKLEIVEASEIKFREDYVIKWQDVEFERLIREYLGKETGEIHYDEVKGIEKIEIWGEIIAKTGEQFVNVYSNDWFRLSDGREGGRTGKIRTLTDLEHFTSLKDLSVNHQENLDISALADIDVIDCLLRLESLSLISDRLSDISVFSNLSALRSINIVYNDVTDISPLAMLIELKNIYIHNNPKLISTEPLKGLRKLERIGLFDVDTVNLEVFVGLPELKSMQLGNNRNMDYNVLLKLELEDLGITCTDETFPVISQLKTLKTLRLYGWSIWDEERQERIALTDISRIGELDNLVSLDLLTEECHDISPLSKLQNIERLELWLPEDCDLTPLKDLPNLKTVVVPSYRNDEMKNKLVEKLKALLPDVEVKDSY